MQKDLNFVLTVYVGDFKLGGIKESIHKGWDLIRSKIWLAPPH